MVQTMNRKSDAPLDNRDIRVCQQVFEVVRAEASLTRDCEEAERIATITIELYRQGVCDPDHLKIMVEAARGLFAKNN